MKKSRTAIVVMAVFAWTQAEALVGPAETGTSLADHVVMVIKRTNNGSAFCSGVVLARNIIMTAAHCVARPLDLRILPGPGGARDLIEVADVAIHPGFRPNATKTRERSIDLAMVRISRPLPARFRAAGLETGTGIAAGTPFTIAGFGVTREGDESSAGRLRAGSIAARKPLSSILLWAHDPRGKGLGACTGDSGGPVFAHGTTAVVAITVWATGFGKRHCGNLTQAALIRPQRKWIDGILDRWGAR